MEVECINDDVADEVQGIFLQYGLQFRRQGPPISSPAIHTVHVTSVGEVPSEKEADLRRAIGSITGARITT
jgi:hypothetical protein